MVSLISTVKNEESMVGVGSVSHSSFFKSKSIPNPEMIFDDSALKAITRDNGYHQLLLSVGYQVDVSDALLDSSSTESDYLNEFKKVAELVVEYVGGIYMKDTSTNTSHPDLNVDRDTGIYLRPDIIFCQTPNN